MRSTPLFVTTSAIGLSSLALAQPQIRELNVLPMTNYANVEGISADGRWAVGECAANGSGPWVACRWRITGEVENLHVPPSTPTTDVYAVAVSADGAYVVGYDSLNGGYRWSAATGAMPLETRIDRFLEPNAINADGSVIVGTTYFNAGDNQAFQWMANGADVRFLDTQGGSVAFAVSGDGTVVAGTSSSGIAALWTNGGATQPLGVLPGDRWSEAWRITSDARVVVGISVNSASTRFRVFRWTSLGGMRDLVGSFAGAREMQVFAINGDALRIGGRFSRTTGGSVAMLWTPASGIVDANAFLAAQGLPLSGWNLALISGISDDGTTIVGTGTRDGRSVSFAIVGLPRYCPADLDDGSGAGTTDGGVTIDDLLYYLTLYALGDIRADIDDGSATGAQDGGVTIDDLLYYLFRFESGC